MLKNDNSQSVDRGDAVNLAHDLINSGKSLELVTATGIACLADAVLRMDAALKEQPHGPSEPVKKWLAFDVGCIECGEESAVIGTYATKEEAEAACKTAEVEQEKNWHGQHSMEVFPLSDATSERVCNSENCDWSGPESECRMLGAVGPLCPRCGETTEKEL